MCVLRGDRGADLAQRAQIVQNPERTAVSGDGEVVIVNDEVVNRRVRKIVLKRLPVRAVVKGNPDAGLGPRVKQSFAPGIFAHGVDVGIVRQAGDDLVQVLPKSVVLKM